MSMKEEHRGSCLCGSVRFIVSGRIGVPDACHCTNCRKQSGHFFASGNVPRASLALTGEEHLTWYRSSPEVRRGFCSKCGSTLFWDPSGYDWIAIAMGSFDAPTHTHLDRHIFVSEKGDYYELDDGLPQREKF
jgi:hypothetical protein